MALGLGIGLGLPFGGAASAAAVAGASPTTFSTTPQVHYHPNSQSGGAGYTTAGTPAQVTACPSLGTLAAAMSGISSALATIGPFEMTDALGRKFWRFNGAQYALISNTLTAVANRAITTVMVGRVHHSRSDVTFLRPRFAAYTDPTTNTVANASILYMRGFAISNSAMFLQAGTPSATTNATDCYKVIPGCQMQVLGVASRTTANGGTRLYMNNDTCDVAQQSTSVSGYIGGIIGGQGTASNSEAVTVSTSNTYDIYEIAIWTGELSNATADANVAAAVSNYAIPAIAKQLILEGDSITDGVNTSLAVSPRYAGAIGTQLTEPGASLIPENVKVVNQAASGSTIATVTTRRDATNSVFSLTKYAGGAANNIVVVQVGRNDAAVAGPASTGVPATMYSALVALWNTVTTGYLQRGFSGVQVGNIASSAAAISGSPPDAPTTVQARIEGLRALLFTGASANATFLTDTLTNTGQAYEGLIAALPLHLVEVSGNTAFLTSTDAADTAAGYYDSDSTHLRVAGIAVMASGGDNAAYGYGSIL